MMRCVECGGQFVFGEAFEDAAGQVVCLVCEGRRARIKREKAAQAVATVETAPVQQPQPARRRCPHYAAIKEFFSVAREIGLDTSKDAQGRCRGAVGMMLGRRVESRSELSGAEWAFATNAVRMGRLFW